MSAFYSEIELFPAQWMRNLIDAGHIAPGVVADGDMRELRAVDLAGHEQCHFFAGLGGWSYALRLAGWPDDRPVWTGSCPCQPFSVAGQGRGTDDERHLWPDWFGLIRECRPPVIFGEQVASKAALAWWDAVSDGLEGSGYTCWAADLCAASVGAPHIRQRLYWVAYTDDRRRDWRPSDGRRHGYGSQARRHQDAGHIAGGGAVRELADAMQPGRTEGRTIAGDRQAAWCGGTDGPSGVALGDTCGSGLAQRNDERGDGQPQQPSAQRAGGHAWSDCDWLPCRDGKARPVEPGTFPLAHGLSGRVGRLRAYGNAIVPQVAAEFVKAVMAEIAHA